AQCGHASYHGQGLQYLSNTQTSLLVVVPALYENDQITRSNRILILLLPGLHESLFHMPLWGLPALPDQYASPGEQSNQILVPSMHPLLSISVSIAFSYHQVAEERSLLSFHIKYII